MASPKSQPEYQNNPFYVATDGLTLLFKMAQSVAIFFVVICSISLVSGIIPNPGYYDGGSQQPFSPKDGEMAQDTFARELAQIPGEVWALIAVIGTIVLLCVVFVSVTIKGINDYTAAHLAKGTQVNLGQAFRGVMSRFFGYLWLQIWVSIKIFLWTLLLIVPGIIMTTRYSLSGVAFFGDKLGAQAATKRSAHLTKGAWLTTFASYSLFDTITFGLIQPLLQPGTGAILFRQYSAYDKSKLNKPSAHALSWVTFFVVFTLVVLLVCLLTVALLWFASALSH